MFDLGAKLLNAFGDLTAALGASALEGERVELLKLRDVEYLLAQVMQELPHSGINPLAIDALRQHVGEGALQRRHRRGGIVEWARHEVAQRGLDARQIREAGLDHQRVGERGVLRAVFAGEALLGAFHGGGELTAQHAPVEDSFERFAEHFAKHLPQHVRQKIEHHNPLATLDRRALIVALAAIGLHPTIYGAAVPRLQLASVYRAKYQEFYPNDSNVYAVRPKVVFGFIENAADFAGSATR